MSYATSRPKVNQFVGGVDIAATLRTHLLANNANRKADRMRVVANTIAASARIHPIRLTKIMRRGAALSLVLDLVN